MAEDLRIAVVELRRRVGTRREVRRSVHLGDASVAGTAAGPEPVELDVMLESVLEGVMASGVVRSGWTAACRRCLGPVAGRIEVEVHELFESGHVPGETYPLEHDHIDLLPLVREAVLLALPLGPLCDADCRGPDPGRFPTSLPGDDDTEAVGSGADEGDSPPGDPRWAVLSELRFDD